MYLSLNLSSPGANRIHPKVKGGHFTLDVIFPLIWHIWPTCMGVFLCVWRLFAHGDKQLLCTWPGPRAKDGSGTWPHGAFSPATAHHITWWSRKQPVCTQRPPSYMCLPGHIFRAWHSSSHTCQHFLSLSLLFSWMLAFIVLITSQCAAEISQGAAAETSGLIDVKSHGEDEDGEEEEQIHTHHLNWNLWQPELELIQVMVDFVGWLKNPQCWPPSEGLVLK